MCNMYKQLATYILLLFCLVSASAQERVGPLFYVSPTTDGSYHVKPRAAAKGTANTLPFFEDFSYDTFFPDSSKWLDRKVYVNNNMGVDPISWGVATFDGIDVNGLPYEPEFKTVLRYADSLTSQPFDLSSYGIGDSLYLSFFYQPAGNGFDPQPEDSLMLYFRRTNTTNPWTRVWRVSGRAMQPFTQVMIPLNEANFFHGEFQFRFVNKASVNNADDHWHIDYIRLDANRNINDTLIQDVAFVDPPSFLLGDYTYMPYHQFIANAGVERAAQHEVSIKNNNTGSVTVNYGYNAEETVNGTALNSGTGNVTIAANTESIVSFPVYSNTVPAPLKNEPVTFEQKYYLEPGGNTGPVANDTIIRKQHFHNYLAYDDGTPEKSYYLNLFATLPGKIAIEYRLNEPDTLRGIAIYFGRQVPLAYQKFFSVAVYKNIDVGGSAEDVIYQEDFLIPGYLQQNAFWYYKFEQPVPLQSGTFYIGTIQPALGASDSLYFGLDVQRTANNHVFYNVVDNWEQSSINGAVMMRPLFGKFFPSVISTPVNKRADSWSIVPNPATDRIRFTYNHSRKDAQYTITGVNGSILQHGAVPGDGWVDINGFAPGTYIVHFSVGGKQSTPKKITKL